MSNAPIRVHVTHTYTSDPKTVFEALSEHENLGPVFGAKITRKSDGDAHRNGVGSSRKLNIGPLPPISSRAGMLGMASNNTCSPL